MKALPWPVGRYRRILPALTTNQNAGFVTVPSEKKNNNIYLIVLVEIKIYFTIKDLVALFSMYHEYVELYVKMLLNYM